ncbi:interleukin-17 domain-containing protein [Ditylenchus destructor]|uniref:Interleukin-17 domain-containing protein n=1 Tax=Ditylenchus destructor TaxID=166010 RepID=A0AAD4R6C4_9BILA|nr:interleukin-17 domain-containing protein [Ditylenchus destructor]
MYMTVRVILLVHFIAAEVEFQAKDDYEDNRIKPLSFLMPSNAMVKLLRNLFHQQKTEPSMHQKCSLSDLNSNNHVKRTMFYMISDTEKSLWKASSNPFEKDNSHKQDNCAEWNSTAEDDLGLRESDPDILPDMPIERRSLCGFQYEDNINEKRLPRKIRECKCLCNAGRNKFLRNRFPNFRCEPLYYDVPVLSFDETCTNYTHNTEKIALACIPVFTSRSTVLSVHVTTELRQKPSIEI